MLYHIYSVCGDDEYYHDTIEGEKEAIEKAEYYHKRDERLGEKYTIYKVYKETEDGYLDFDDIVYITEGR